MSSTFVSSFSLKKQGRRKIVISKRTITLRVSNKILPEGKWRTYSLVIRRTKKESESKIVRHRKFPKETVDTMIFHRI